MNKPLSLIIYGTPILVAFFFILCSFETSDKVSDDYWIRFCDNKNQCGYLNSKGDTMIRAGKYSTCQTDTFRNYAIVANESGWIAINKSEQYLYNVHTLDNGPDYPSEGLFRIWKNNKMGYADEKTGVIILYPQYSCGFPFENGRAKVSYNCSIESDGEYHTWLSSTWFFIDHQGRKVDSLH